MSNIPARNARHGTGKGVRASWQGNGKGKGVRTSVATASRSAHSPDAGGATVSEEPTRREVEPTNRDVERTRKWWEVQGEPTKAPWATMRLGRDEDAELFKSRLSKAELENVTQRPPLEVPLPLATAPYVLPCVS